MGSCRVNVLMATFNGGQFISEQIKSILNQQSCSVDLTIRDDGSNDNTLTILEDFSILFPLQFNLIKDKIGSSGSACKNFFLLLLSADLDNYDYIAFADQDDFWFPDKLSHAISNLTKSNSDVYSSDMLIWDGTNVIGELKKNGRKTNFDYLFQGASAGCTYVMNIKAATEIVSHLTISKICELSKESSHDWIIYAILRSRGFNWFHDSKAKILYRQHSTNVYGAKKLFTNGNIKMVTSGWYRNNIITAYNFSKKNIEAEKILFRISNNNFLVRIYSIVDLHKTRRELLHKFLLYILIITGFLSPLSSKKSNHL